MKSIVHKIPPQFTRRIMQKFQKLQKQTQSNVIQKCFTLGQNINCSEYAQTIYLSQLTNQILDSQNSTFKIQLLFLQPSYYKKTHIRRNQYHQVLRFISSIQVLAVYQSTLYHNEFEPMLLAPKLTFPKDWKRTHLKFSTHQFRFFPLKIGSNGMNCQSLYLLNNSPLFLNNYAYLTKPSTIIGNKDILHLNKSKHIHSLPQAPLLLHICRPINTFFYLASFVHKTNFPHISKQALSFFNSMLQSNHNTPQQSFFIF
eukprot:TRINITY_DN18675_c0_g1_i2.p1 TRINITY_DN18675_c0_g1~~TRINITY_DN18675_c0_g1_i2.p1  ORF type:complete len:257 (+),score=-26.45 TRINITY_DN18675_c0_g1_i2:73-843(+)